MNDIKQISKIKLADILEKIVEEMDDWVIIGDKQGKIVYANENVYECCGCTKENVLGQDMCMFVGVDLSDEKMLDKIQEFIDKRTKLQFVTNRFVKNNQRIYLTNTLTTTWDAERLEYCVCISKDVTSTEKLKEEIYKASYFDYLTHYPNQQMFIESVARQLARAQKNQSTFAVILIDIKKLGEINHNYSMNVGDRVIKAVGKRIASLLTTKQEIFKYSGDAFAVIQEDIKDEEEIISFLRRLEKVLDTPVKIHNSEFYVELKAGVAVYPNHAGSAGELVKKAQIAVAKVKKENKHYLFYSRDIHEEVRNIMLVEQDLQEAVERDEFIVYYQPFVDLETNKIVGMEALVRRQKPTGEVISPGSFIGILEQSNLIEKVGMQVLEKVCRQLRYWIDNGYSVVPVSVNLSAKQFKNPNLAQDIEKTLARYDISPCLVVLEITESTVMEDVGIAQLTVEELKRDGFAISIDDFGTGYASIGYLKKFMFDHLKIDISFIREIVKNNEDRSIVEAIIAIAKTLNLKTIAEGIENEDQLYVMSALGCEMGQGFFWDKPITSTMMEEKYLKAYA